MMIFTQDRTKGDNDALGYTVYMLQLSITCQQTASPRACSTLLLHGTCNLLLQSYN